MVKRHASVRGRFGESPDLGVEFFSDDERRARRLRPRTGGIRPELIQRGGCQRQCNWARAAAQHGRGERSPVYQRQLESSYCHVLPDTEQVRGPRERRSWSRQSHCVRYTEYRLRESNLKPPAHCRDTRRIVCSRLSMESRVSLSICAMTCDRGAVVTTACWAAMTHETTSPATATRCGSAVPSLAGRARAAPPDQAGRDQHPRLRRQRATRRRAYP